MSQRYRRGSDGPPPEPPEQETKKFEIEDVLVNPYEVLGLDASASLADIKKAYFANVREHPPEQDPEAFKRIRAAYDMLRTAEAKAATDLFMLNPPVAYEPYKRPPSFSLDIQAGDLELARRLGSDLARTDFSADYRKVEL